MARLNTSVRKTTARRLRTVIITAIMCAAAVIGWSQFGPVQLGGSASYVVTDGTSMLPTFKADGLVVTRAQAHYQVGDVVAYYNHQLKTVVMHRIVALDGNRYVFKGDNNTYRDQYHATRSDLVGKEWVYWPGGGVYLRTLQQPVVFAAIIGALGFVAATGFVPTESRRRRRARRARARVMHHA